VLAAQIRSRISAARCSARRSRSCPATIRTSRHRGRHRAKVDRAPGPTSCSIAQRRSDRFCSGKLGVPSQCAGQTNSVSCRDCDCSRHDSGSLIGCIAGGFRLAFHGVP
jgi:hypothetical protein